ncbi:hypothetical protein APA_2116 [Pseudanabaena sp. lw0831]|nr:hypothetical protein APA_2116 [Pseudanabaena sp. lw0831]
MLKVLQSSTFNKNIGSGFSAKRCKNYRKASNFKILDNLQTNYL